MGERFCEGVAVFFSFPPNKLLKNRPMAASKPQLLFSQAGLPFFLVLLPVLAGRFFSLSARRMAIFSSTLLIESRVSLSGCGFAFEDSFDLPEPDPRAGDRELLVELDLESAAGSCVRVWPASALSASVGSTSPILELMGDVSDLNPPLRRRPPFFCGELVLGV